MEDCRLPGADDDCSRARGGVAGGAGGDVVDFVRARLARVELDGVC